MACSYSLLTHCSFGSNKNKRDFYRGKDPMKKVICRPKKARDRNNRLC